MESKPVSSPWTKALASATIDWAHRGGIIGLLTLLAAIAAVALHQNPKMVLIVAFSCQYLALTAAGVAWWAQPGDRPARREAIGAFIFNAVLTISILVLMLSPRLLGRI